MICRDCQGTGIDDPRTDTDCGKCDGTGRAPTDEWARQHAGPAKAGAVMGSVPSFVSRSTAIFGPDEIEVRWHESEQYDSTYVVELGRGTRVHLRPEDARELLAKLSSAMAARGDIVDYAALAAEAITALESVAHELNWNTNGRSSSLANLRETLDRLGYHAEPTGADEIDVVCDRERDAQIGVC